MASIIYLKINGERQGLISAGASSVDSIGNKYQSGHEDEIFIYELMNQFTRLENVSLHPVDIRKPIDKSTPLLAQALNDKEKLNCEFLLYRTSSLGGHEVFFKISLKDAIVNDIRYFYPNSLTDNDGQPQENVSFKFSSITLEHVIARTSSYMLWSDSIY
ncbi:MULTISPECIES: Hcp family type VI secretion system effector [Pectobacterium]|uniref:Hcp family type VI secretion system effector n=1 Tax=Pectobacterium versatile TaxID=2488639 RepID=A0AAW3RVI1_9GAMM|nr:MULTISPECIES: Hcp family type VI secretion system effector [Pectobacterium]AVT60649.1 secreted protein Hcp [Pectobacterium versatile]AZK64521.1 Hcp family type VI secretion system effector [Pectobacterium versatile]KGA34788.1 Hcp [Pectobacterium odoriferum]MBA0159942.1 Hcp family type VI secretion system effector [Pectobacterium versatile]MBA0163052.1 Hcp family type VI secretion system effector [Pectobacterium versatile]